MLPSTAHAALDPATKKPYELQIVLHVAANRVFTPLFHDQLRRDVRNRLHLAFGALAKIELTREHPLLTKIEAYGLNQAIEEWEALSDRATHFVLVEYVAGSYRIHARFHDGMTGQVGPFARRETVNDRAAVAGAIARLIEASFSPVGTVTDVGKTVTLKLRGGELGVPMERWVKPGDVFAVSRIAAAGGKPRAARVEWALLEVVDGPTAGACRCRYWHRYQEDDLSAGAGALGYRALRLPTSAGPIKVQLLDETTLAPIDGARVRVRPPGGGKAVDLLTNRDGFAVTRQDFAHLALVQVLSGEAVRAQFPVERIEDRIPVARVKLQTDRESLAYVEVRYGAWLRRVYENVRMSSDRAAELSAQLNQSLQATLESGRKSLPPLREEIQYLDRERDDLDRLAREKKLTFKLREGEQQLAELRKQAKELHAFVERIESAVKDSGNENSLGLVKLLERARLDEAQADFDAAIRLYRQVVQASPEQTKVQAHLDRLVAAWKTKNDAHQAARDFIYNTWPTLDLGGLGEKMDEATQALATCKDADDRLTPLKLLCVNAAHTAHLKRQLDLLKRRDSEDNRNQAKALLEISGRLLRLHHEAAALVSPRKGA